MAGQQAAKSKELLFRPYHRKNSDRMLESTKDSASPEFLNQPEQLTVSNHSFVVVDAATGKRRATRWYLGCDTIWLDEQPKDKKIEFKDTIHINGGILSLEDTVRDHQLFEFLRTHNSNMSNPDRVAPREGEDMCAFEQINYENDALKRISLDEQKELAYQELSRTKTGIGENRKFDEGALLKLKVLFGLQQATPAEVYSSLYEIAGNDPTHFLSTIEMNRQLIVSDFDAAQKTGVLKFQNGTYMLNEKPVYTTAVKDVKKQDPDFIDWLSRPEGFAVYTEMRNLTQKKLTDPQ